MKTRKQIIAKQQGLRYWSSLTPQQKNRANDFICKLLSDKYPAEYTPPKLWKILWDVSYMDIIRTKAKADEFCKGYCFKYRDIYLPLLIKNI